MKEQAKQRTSRAKHSQGETGDKGTMDGEHVVNKGVLFYVFGLENSLFGGDEV